MGSVWAAKLHGPYAFEKLVAIKTVLPDLAGDGQARARFLDEARLVSAIAHRNVAHVVDFLEHEEALYIVMEWVDGVSLMWLKEQLEERGADLPLGMVLRVLADVCAGLHAAHELRSAEGELLGVVHRDVSPHNVLVTPDGSAKLIDFGVAKTRFRAACDSSIGHLRGRIAFMAPEQAHSEHIDRRADVWSIGASLLYVLTGHGPYGSAGRADALRRLLRQEQPLSPPSDLPASVSRILSGCLALRREDRFATAEQVGWAIENAIEDMGVTASSRDVAAFLDEWAGDYVRSQRQDIGRSMTSGRVAVPRELTMLQTGSLPALGSRSRKPWRTGIAATVAACAVLPLIATLVPVSSGHAPAGEPIEPEAAFTSASATVHAPLPPASVTLPPPAAAPAPEDAGVARATSEPAVSPAKQRSAVRHVAPLPRSKHDRHGGPHK